VALGDRALQRGVAVRFIGMAAKEVAEREMTELVIAADRADMQVMGARALGRLAEEVVVGRHGRRSEQAPEPLQRVALQRCLAVGHRRAGR
jgi:hypothetical protein